MLYELTAQVNVQLGVQSEIEAKSREEALKIFKNKITKNLNSEPDFNINDMSIYQSTVQKVYEDKILELV